MTKPIGSVLVSRPLRQDRHVLLLIYTFQPSHEAVFHPSLLTRELCFRQNKLLALDLDWET